MLVKRIAAFVRGESGDSFEELALEVFRFQYERVAPLRELCERRDVAPDQVSGWREVPAVLVSDLASPVTADGPTARHAYRDLSRTVIQRSFPATCLAEMGRPPVLSLVPSDSDPSDDDPSDSGPGCMADRLPLSLVAPDSSVAMARRGVEVAQARSFLGARQRDRRPTLLLATTATLAQLLDGLDRRGLRFRLPPGSRLIEVGGKAPDSRELLARLAEGLGVPAEGVVREYGVDGLTSRFYANRGQQGDLRPFRTPPWVRVRALEADTLAESAAGTAGRLAVFDLVNMASAAHLLTDGLVVAGEDGFQLA